MREAALDTATKALRRDYVLHGDFYGKALPIPDFMYEEIVKVVVDAYEEARNGT